jgi:HPt (histidine-containing phosphotransfer) domain-containing protein
MSSQDAIRALIEKHCATLRGEASDITSALSHWSDAPDLACARAIKATHKIKGSSGTIGFHDVSMIAEQLEYAFRALEDEEEALLTREIYDLTHSLTETVSGLDPAQSSLYHKSF